MEYHKHKGVMSKGVLKSHPISQKHKDKKVQIEHNKVTKNNIVKKVLKKVRENKLEDVNISFVRKPDNNINFNIDDDGYIFIDLDKTNVTGLKLLFTRNENLNGKETKRSVALQFENLPARELRSGERFENGRWTLRKKY